MCGIAGIIHRGKSNNVGGEMQKMLQSLKHRGPDSTGYALYGEGESNNYILRYKVGENVKEGTTAVKEDPSVYAARRKEVDKKINEVGATIYDDEKITDYSFRYVISYDGDLLDLALQGGVVEKMGSWFSYKGDKIAQGREKVKALLDTDEKLMKNVLSDVKDYLELS